MNRFEDRFYGTIFGQAIGDALGLGTESMSRKEVQETYPSGFSTYGQIIQDRHRSRWKRGDWTDDTDMMLCILNAIVEKQAVDYHAIAHHFKDWFLQGGMGIGRTTYNVLCFGDYVSNPQRAAEIVWKLGRQNNAANGGIMRTSVVGLLNEQVVSYASNICKLTHFDPRCVGSCVIVSELIHQLVYADTILRVEDVLRLADLYDERIRPFVILAYNSKDIYCLQLDEIGKQGYTLKTLAAALWAYWHAGSFKEGILSLVNAGGDADTNAAVAGALLGAKYGYEGIPAPYRSSLLRKQELYGDATSFLNFCLPGRVLPVN